jgi:hypothetical protein
VVVCSLSVTHQWIAIPEGIAEAPDQSDTIYPGIEVSPQRSAMKGPATCFLGTQRKIIDCGCDRMEKKVLAYTEVGIYFESPGGQSINFGSQQQDGLPRCHG